MVVLLVMWPMLAFFKAFWSIVSSVLHEDMHRKVVLITGASSGIGEVCSLACYCTAAVNCN